MVCRQAGTAGLPALPQRTGIGLSAARYVQVKWSQAQKSHRWRIGQAAIYASAAVADPEIRPIYVQLALDLDMNPKRPFDAAVSDYFHHGNDLLWKKHMGDREKPQNCDLRMYPWYVRKQKRSRKRST